MPPDEKKLYQAVFRSLRSALCLTAKEADIHLIRAYADESAPEPAASMNVCYYFLQSDPSAPLLQETETTSSTHVVYSFIPCKLALVCYGPDCESWAHRCGSFLFLDGPGKPRQILREMGLYLIPNPPAPTVIYEETGKKYRKRADLVLDVRLLDDSAYGSIISHKTSRVDIITSVPEVSVHIAST